MLKQSLVNQFLDWFKLKIEIETKKDVSFYFHEREIWWSHLGANIGFEQDGKHVLFERPVLVLKKFNKESLMRYGKSSRRSYKKRSST